MSSLSSLLICLFPVTSVFMRPLEILKKVGTLSAMYKRENSGKYQFPSPPLILTINFLTRGFPHKSLKPSRPLPPEGPFFGASVVKKAGNTEGPDHRR